MQGNRILTCRFMAIARRFRSITCAYNIIRCSRVRRNSRFDLLKNFVKKLAESVQLIKQITIFAISK